MDGYEKDILNVYFKNENKIIKLGNNKYLFKEYDLSILKILEDKKDNIKYLEIDDNIFNEELEINYYKSSIYIIQSNKKKDISISFGKIKGIIKSKLTYSYYTYSNSEGLLILNLSNNKIIGLHRNNSNNYNKGILLKDIIKSIFNEQKYKNEKNEINLLINVDKNDINKRIYFLDNYDNRHNHLKELNDLKSKKSFSKARSKD